MKPERPVSDAYDDHYQISPHFAKTPGLTVIPDSSPNYDINEALKPKLGALYRKYGFHRCPNYGLFWAGWPQFTMIPDRDKMVVLVVELKKQDIESWDTIDEEVRKILSEHGWDPVDSPDEPDLAGRGVCVRYYQFWEGRREVERKELLIAKKIEAGEEVPDDSESSTQPDPESIAQLEEAARLPRLDGLLARGQLREPASRRTTSTPSLARFAQTPASRRSSPTPAALTRAEEIISRIRSTPQRDSLERQDGWALPFYANRTPSTEPNTAGSGSVLEEDPNSSTSSTRVPFTED